MQEPQCQMLTARLFILFLPQNEEVYLVYMPSNFNFLHYFPEGGTIAGAIFPNEPDFLGACSHVSGT